MITVSPRREGSLPLKRRGRRRRVLKPHFGSLPIEEEEGEGRSRRKMLKLPAKAASTAKADPSLSLPPPPSVVVVVRSSQTSEQVFPLPPLWSHIHGDGRRRENLPSSLFLAWAKDDARPRTADGRTAVRGRTCGAASPPPTRLFPPQASPPPRLALATVRRHQPETLHFSPSSVFYYLSAAAVWPTGSRPSSSFLSPIFYSAYSADTSHRDSAEQ